jgi:hypothetical protein
MLRDQGDTRISRRQNKAVFSVADPRMIHKIASKDDRGFDRDKLIICTDDDGDGDCKYCKTKVPVVRAGQKRWELSMTWANALGVINDSLTHRCACGGKIKRGQCLKCNRANPLNIYKVPFSITRSGSGTSTTYQFQTGTYEEAPVWVAELEPIELESLYRTPTTDKQAELLGVKNILRNSNASETIRVSDDDVLF